MTTPATPPDNPRLCEIGETDWGFSLCVRAAPFCVTRQSPVVGMPTTARLFSCSRHLPPAVAFVQGDTRRPVSVYWQEAGFQPGLTEKPVKERFGVLAEGPAADVEAVPDGAQGTAPEPQPEGA